MILHVSFLRPVSRGYNFSLSSENKGNSLELRKDILNHTDFLLISTHFAIYG